MVIVLCASLKLYNLWIIAKIFNKFIENTYTRQLWFVFWRKFRSISIVLIVKWQFLTTIRAYSRHCPLLNDNVVFLSLIAYIIQNAIFGNKSAFLMKSTIQNAILMTNVAFKILQAISNGKISFPFHKRANYVSLLCV